MTTAQNTQSLPAPVQHFISLTKALTSLLQRENTLLESRRPSETTPLAGEKARLTNDYKTALDALKADEDALLGPKESDIRKLIRAITEQFRAELARHAKLVIRLRTVTEGVVKSITDEVARQRNPMQHYGSSGQMATKTTQPATLSFDKVI